MLYWANATATWGCWFFSFIHSVTIHELSSLMFNGYMEC